MSLVINGVGEVVKFFDVGEYCGFLLFLCLILYGLCGFFVEVMFIVVWYFVDLVKYWYGWKFYGCIFVWLFFIYVFLLLVVE